MSLPTISVMVLNFNGREHLAACLASLVVQDYPPDRRELIVVDNGSSDDSVALVHDLYPTVRVIENGANLGFAGGYNQAIAHVNGDYLAFLNNDTYVEPTWLSELIKPILADPRIACTGSLILNWNGDLVDFSDAALNYIGWGCQPAYGRPYRNPPRAGRDLLFACGGAMLISRAAFVAAGCFDEAYFAYFEDVDLGWRLAQQDQRTVLSPGALAYHRHHGTGSLAAAQRWILLERNALFGVIKNYEDRHLAAVLPAALLLLCERAYLDLIPIERPATVAGGTFGPGYYLRELSTLVRSGRFDQLRLRGRAELARRWMKIAPPSRPVRLPPVCCADVTPDMAATAAARLVAGRAVLDVLPELMEKRRAVQAHRRRRDEDVFGMFRTPLLSNVDDARFAQVMRWAARRFGIRDFFGARGRAPEISAAQLDLAWRVAARILQIMAWALAASGVDRSQNDAGQPALVLNGELAGNTMRALEEMDWILRSLPALPPGDLLAWLDLRCAEVLDRMGVPAPLAGEASEYA